MDTYLLLGGNIGDRLSNIEKAIANINKEIGIVTQRSSVYESEPWGFSHSNNFFNVVVKVETNLSAQELLLKNQQIEKKLGRIKKENSQLYSERNIDIDILLYGGEIINKPHLKIPHIQLHKRRFALLPLSEINPNIFHPTKQMNIRTLLHLCNDYVPVWKLEKTASTYL